MNVRVRWADLAHVSHIKIARKLLTHILRAELFHQAAELGKAGCDHGCIVDRHGGVASSPIVKKAIAIR